jgi:hypothetical protein
MNITNFPLWTVPDFKMVIGEFFTMLSAVAIPVGILEISRIAIAGYCLIYMILK